MITEQSNHATGAPHETSLQLSAERGAATAALRAVLFDLGGTLEDVDFDDALRRDATRGLQELMLSRGLDAGLSLDALYERVVAGLKRYQAWREQREVELPPERVWTEFVFPDCGLPQHELAAAAEDLAFYYETHYHRRRLKPEAPAALAALAARGLRLAVISNIMSRRLVPWALERHGIAHYFEHVLTSVGVGWRKPNERIFLEAARRLDLAPRACAYVGDTISRDVAGAQRAGYGMSIQIRSFLTGISDRPGDTARPDAVIASLMDVVALVGQGASQSSSPSHLSSR